MIKDQEHIRLSSDGLARSANVDKDSFTFVVNQMEFKCGMFQAAFISGYVHRLIAADCTVDRFEILNIENAHDFFDAVLALTRGESLNVCEANYRTIREITKALENQELLSLIDKSQIDSQGTLSLSNCISLLRRKYKCGMPCDAEVKFVASHFYELVGDQLGTLPCAVLETVVSQNCLQLWDEDSFLDFLLGYDDKYLSLLGYVECKFLSEAGMEDFLCYISTDCVTSQTWDSVCRRLVSGLCNTTLPKYRFADLHGFPLREGEELCGILDALSKLFQGNVDTKGAVQITSSGDMMNKCRQVADAGWKEWWGSTDLMNSWICFDFKDRAVWLDQYAIKSHKGPSWLLQWKLEGSLDGCDWVTLDKRNTSDLASEWAVKTFNCGVEGGVRFFRYIRLRQTGKNAVQRNHLVFCNIEFFGTLRG
jgi:hypothetical protein